MSLTPNASFVLVASYGPPVAAWAIVNVRRACITTLAAASLLATIAPGAAAQDKSASAEPLPERVLFVGNSHTSRHGGLDWLIGNFVAAEDSPRSFDGSAETEGGVTLEYHWRNGARDRIVNGRFDTVVLQGYLPGSDSPSARSFIEHARLLDSVVRGSGAETVFFMTWPRGFNDWSSIDDVIEAHRVIESELGVPIAPAAVAFEMAMAERPDIQLMSDDQIHATWEGAYLAAATVYATLFDCSPEGLQYTFGVSQEDAAFLQRIAWQALTEWRAEAHPTEET
jgi:hypothetical protein